MNQLDIRSSRLAARQHGVVTRLQALELGLTARQIDRRAAAGALIAIHRGVYRVAAAPPSFEQALMAACLATGGAASHRAAGALLRLRGIEVPPIEITVPGDVRRVLGGGIITHRAKVLVPADLATCAGIPMTRPARILLDLGAVAPHRVEAATEDALFRKLVTVESLWRVVERVGSRGRAGTAVLRHILETREPHQRPTESPLEDEIIAVLRRYGLPEPVRQYEVPRPGRKPLRLDTSYPEVLVDIEGDGVRWHISTADMQRDRDRDNFLTRLGWAILRFTRDDCRRRPARLAAQVNDVLAARRALLAG